MTSLPQIDLARIRHHGGAQHRAFEELAYLLAWDMEGLDEATEIERRGTPDGGIEFSCLPAGRSSGRWAWQAKYLFQFDASTFRQMTDSVISALDSTPDLERHIFVFPKDRSTSGLSKWKAAVKKWRQEAKKRQMTVDFLFRGHSQLVTALTSDQHSGAIRYFFDEQFLTEDFFATQVEQEVLNLGDRYDPRVNVETEARRIVDAACRGRRFVDELVARVGAVAEDQPPASASTALERLLRDSSAVVSELLARWKPDVALLLENLGQPGDAVFLQLKEAAMRFRRGLEARSTLIDARLDELNDQSQRAAQRQKRPRANANASKRKTRAELAEDERERRRETLREFDRFLYRTRRKLDEVLWYLESDETKAAVGGSVLLVGEAGCGKSHLVADLAKERVAENSPSCLLLGQALGNRPLGPQLVSLLGLDSMTLSDVLQAIDVAARVRGNGRALLVVDALNEGAGAELWEHSLRGFVAQVARYDWIALVLTVRDVYEHAVAPSGAGEVIRSVHRGLAGHEEEALSLYAGLYNLRLPDVPALLPELSNPLFLRSLCQSVHGRGLSEIPRDATSLVWVFDGLISAIDDTLQRPSRLDFGAWEHKVRRAIDAIATAMVDTDSEWLSLEQAREICLDIHAEPRNSLSLLNGLIVEGLLLKERINSDGVPTEAVRFTYQRLSDHLRAQVLLERNPTDRELAAAIRAAAKAPRPWAMSGVIGALVLLVPERRGKELATVLRFGKFVATDRYARRDTPSVWLRHEVQSAFFDSLMWRSPSAFTPSTRQLLNRYLDAGIVDSYEWLRIITGLACIPDHPLNSDWLDSILWDMSLPDRDEVWSRELLWLYSDDANPISRTIDWAWANPDAPVEVTRLAGLFLSWLFTSPNRRLRDTATKALVSITTGKTQVLAEIAERFAAVNDPFVLDRVLAAAYGHVLRLRHQPRRTINLDELGSLRRAVFNTAFDESPTTHLMMRHRARSCVQVIDSLCREPPDVGSEGAIIDPPYGSTWPLRAPTTRVLARRFGRPYTGYVGSSTELDWEFEDRVVGSIVTDLVLPNQSHLRGSRRRKLLRERDAALQALVDAAPPSRKVRVQRRAESLVRATPANRWVERSSWDAFDKSLSGVARKSLAKLREAVSALQWLDDEVFHPDPSLCARWVAARILDLGWTKEKFGDQNKGIARGFGERADVRIAKKYELIAVQELCGHLTDHCLVEEGYHEPPVPYQGPWQIPETLDIDESLLLRGDEPESDTPAARLRTIRLRVEAEPTWWRTLIDHELASDNTDDNWLSDMSDIPRPEEFLRAVDPAGREWVALERHDQWSVEDPTILTPSYNRNWRMMWFRSQANIICSDDKLHPRWAANENWMGLRALSTPIDVWTAGPGTYPDMGGWPSVLDRADAERRPYGTDQDPGINRLPKGWEYAQIDEATQAPYSIATTGCHQETGTDFSTTDTPNVIMPSRILLAHLGAHWSGGLGTVDELRLGPVEREYSWVANGRVVAFCASGREYGSGSALWVRAEPLRETLERANLAMWSWTLGEKIYWKNHDASSDRTDSFAAVRLAPGPLTTWGYTIERDHGRGRGKSGRREQLLVERSNDGR